MINDNNKELFGKILFSLGIIAFILMLFSPLNNLLFHVDEYFTLGLIKFPIMQGITITANDVHPPLYYILLKCALKIFPNSDIVFVSKIMTIIPYFIILLISATKIRKEYNWLTAGLFAFALFVMSSFFRFYITIRMYSWAVLFLIASFIVLKDLLVKSDLKSWFLFSLFTLLGAYTHYFNPICSIIIYLCLLGYFIINNKKSEIKKWFVSVICLIIGYSPWLLNLFIQLRNVHANYWIPQLDLEHFIRCFSFYATSNTEMAYMALAIAVLILLFIVYISDYRNHEKLENHYILLGMLLFIMTAVVGTVISFLFKPILIVRYLLAPVGVFWLAVSILIGRIENNKLLIISLFLIMILGIVGVCGIMDSSASFQKDGIDQQNLFNEMDQDNNTVICIDPGVTTAFGTYFDNSDVYTDAHNPFTVDDKYFKKLFNITQSSNLNKTIDEDSNKNIYIIANDLYESDLIDRNNSLYDMEVYHFYEV